MSTNEVPRATWVHELGGCDGESGWWRGDNATAVLTVLTDLIELGASETKARKIIESITRAIRSEYGD